jgi:copper chaperone
MTTTTLEVKGMSCSHCVNAIESALNKLNGVETFNVDLSGNQVTLSYDEEVVQIEKVKEAIEEEGYDVV